ncbi:hypothetical protein ACFQT0_16390 [Hymenobacter humi]|uniref:DUF3291 domain-containing protein n=1 Tax=Hymenobacter humi TaxID=1411620 RepID=A0ABW2U9B0_9BACT
MPHTTLTVFTLKPGNQRWGLAQMGTSPGPLQRVPGLRFFKLLGSGAHNGFGFWPNLNRYGFMGVWDDAAAALAFLHSTRCGPPTSSAVPKCGPWSWLP